MKKTLLLILSLMLCLTLVLAGCNEEPDEDLTDETTAKKTVVTTEKTTAKTTAKTKPQTTKAPTVEKIPAPEIRVIEKNQPVSRLPEGSGIVVDIFEDTTIELNYHGWPTVCKGEDGVLYATASLRISHIDPFGAVVFCESHDNGETWSEPRIIADTVLDDRDSGVLYLGDGKILVNWFCHNASNYMNHPDYMGWIDEVDPKQVIAVNKRWDECEANDLKGGSFVVLSEDGGKTWSDPVRVPLKSPHGMTMGQDGKTLYFFGVPSANWGMSGVTGLESGYAYLFTSTDYGMTWQRKGSVLLPTNLGDETFFDEGYCIQLADGSFLAGIRTERSDFGHWTICLTRSADGVNWETPAPIPDGPYGVLTGAPPHLLQLKSGAILLSYSCRNGRSCGSRGRVSYDGGVTWSEEFIICVSDQPKNGDLGYPSTVELADGTLLTTYYQAYKTDPHPSLLYTRWEFEVAEESD